MPGQTGEPFRGARIPTASLFPRYEGRWDGIGRRQTKAELPAPSLYRLWAWENPEPDRTIESLEIVPAGPPFIVAAITLGHVDEHPFAKEGRRPARIVLTNPDDAQKPFDLDVEVDRGQSTYVFPLPQASTDEFIEDSYKGWGQEDNGQSSPAYVEVSAIPSATVTVKQGDEEIGSVNWGEVDRKGVVETPKMRFEMIDNGKNWVHVTVLDDDTGRPVPCRVHFRSPEGVPFQPHGHHNQVNSNLGTWHIDVGGDVRLGQITYAYIDGTCQGWLPRGEVIVDVARGYEYEPLRARVNIEPGQRNLELRIKRWINMNERGWFRGLKRPVMPWCSDGLNEAEIAGTMETTLGHWADEAHAQGGFVISPLFSFPNGEPAALIAAGRLDGVEMIRHTEVNHAEYYRYLNGGYRLPLVGGTDKMSSDVPVGIYRTYVHLPEEEEFNYENWCRNVVKGRTFISGGPILHFTVDGREVGDIVQLSGAGTVEVEAWAESILPIYRLEIVQAGKVVASTESQDGTRRLELKDKLKVDGHTWLAARCGGPGYFANPHYDTWRRGIFAHTSPIYVASGGE